MIIDNIKNIYNYKSFSIIYKALQELSKLNIENIPTSTIVYEKINCFITQYHSYLNLNMNVYLKHIKNIWMYIIF